MNKRLQKQLSSSGDSSNSSLGSNRGQRETGSQQEVDQNSSSQAFTRYQGGSASNRHALPTYNDMENSENIEAPQGTVADEIPQLTTITVDPSNNHFVIIQRHNALHPKTGKRIVIRHLNLQDFKRVDCSRKNAPHNHKSCYYYHSIKDKRRDDDYYTPELCKFADTEKCPKRDKCRRAHNRVERLYHKDKYKTKFCHCYPNKIGACEYGEYCSFAHSIEDLKVRLVHNLLPLNADFNFYIFFFKTEWCPYNHEHNKAQCVYAHNFQDFRRKPNLFRYETELCQDWQSGTFITCYEEGCKRLEKCPYSHGWKEQQFHPLVYKTQQCDEQKCFKGFECPFFHSPKDKRVISEDECDLDFLFTPKECIFKCAQQPYMNDLYFENNLNHLKELNILNSRMASSKKAKDQSQQDQSEKIAEKVSPENKNCSPLQSTNFEVSPQTEKQCTCSSSQQQNDFSSIEGNHYKNEDHKEHSSFKKELRSSKSFQQDQIFPHHQIQHQIATENPYPSQSTQRHSLTHGDHQYSLQKQSYIQQQDRFKNPFEIAYNPVSQSFNQQVQDQQQFLQQLDLARDTLAAATFNDQQQLLDQQFYQRAARTVNVPLRQYVDTSHHLLPQQQNYHNPAAHQMRSFQQQRLMPQNPQQQYQQYQMHLNEYPNYQSTQHIPQHPYHQQQPLMYHQTAQNHYNDLQSYPSPCDRRYLSHQQTNLNQNSSAKFMQESQP